MGWKSTITITRRQAIEAIMKVLEKTPYDEKTNEELDEIMISLGIGNEVGKPYFGHNFWIVDTDEDLPKDEY